MQVVRSRARSHVHGARCGQLGGKIEARLAELKLLDTAGRDVGCGGTKSLVRNVDAVHLDAGGTAEAATKRDGRITFLEPKTEAACVLNLNARLQLCQIKEVAAIHRQ